MIDKIKEITRKIFEKYNENGIVRFEYNTTVYIGKLKKQKACNLSLNGGQ